MQSSFANKPAQRNKLKISARNLERQESNLKYHLATVETQNAEAMYENNLAN